MAIFVLEGIHLQMTGALPQPDQQRQFRRDHKRVYYAALEDLAFSVLVGTSFASTGDLPAVGGLKPGAKLATDLRDKHINLSDRGDPDLLAIGQDETTHRDLKKDLERLDVTVAGFGLPFYLTWIEREAIFYLGHDETIYESELDAQQYVFDPPRPYILDRDLLMAVPAGVVNTLVTSLTTLNNRYPGTWKRTPSSRALGEFVRRNLTTHLCVYYCYDQMLKTLEEPYLYIPFPTRASIKPWRKTDPVGLPATLRDTVSRVVLTDLVDGVQRPDQLYDKMLDLSKPGTKYDALQAEWHELLGLDPISRKKEAEKHLGQIRRLQGKGLMCKTELGASAGAASLKGSMEVTQADIDPRRLARTYRQFPIKKLDDLEKRLDEIFFGDN